MLVTKPDDNLWVEKYRPTTIDQCILPKRIKDTLQQFIDNQDMPNLILAGSSGIGKTTVARALCNQLDYEVMFINASLENGIDVLRNKVQDFASSLSLNGKYHVVILDEADYLSNAVQPALRGFIERFSKNTRFIFTCNYSNRIIEPVQSRCTVINFDVDPQERLELVKQTTKRVFQILQNQQIQFDPKVVGKVVLKYFPDIRRTINELQALGAVIDDNTANVIQQGTDQTFDALVQHLRAHDFKSMRVWVAINNNIPSEQVFRYFYDNAHKFMVNQSIPQLVLTTAEYQYKACFAVDQQINLAAYLTDVMANCEFQ